MMNRKLAILTVCFIAVLALSISAMGETMVKVHPMEVEQAVCSMCHTDDNVKAGLDHTSDWYTKHSYAASRNAQICSICHDPSFCTDCHALQEELKPSDKYKDSPGREMPHRGDYLTQHQIDGKINPAPCFRCHGRQNNGRCRVCHK